MANSLGYFFASASLGLAIVMAIAAFVLVSVAAECGTHLIVLLRCFQCKASLDESF